MATAQKITRDNFTTLFVRSTQSRAGTPDGNVYFDTANDKIQLITAEESANVSYPVGHPAYTDGLPEANPYTNSFKAQALALYFFAIQEVYKDPALQNFRTALDAVANRMGLLVGATAFLNAIVLDTNTSTTNNRDHDKIADSGFTEFLVGGGINKVWHGVKSQNPINATTQPYYLLAASTSEADRMAATPVNFPDQGDINAVIPTYENGAFDDRNSVLIICAREFGYTNGEADSVSAGVAELGAYSQGYGIGNSIVSEIAALSYTDVWTTPIAPYNALSFFRHATAQTRTGFSTAGAGASGDFTDEIQLSSGSMSITELRAWLDALMLQDTDQNANTGTTGAFIPKRVKPLYSIDPASAKLVTRAGIYVDPAKLTAEAQQQIILTDDADGQHFVPFNSGITFALSEAWLDDSSPWSRLMYKDALGGNDYDTANALTALDASSVAIAPGGTQVVGLENLDIDSITWQSGTTVRIAFNGTPDLSGITLPARIRVSTAAQDVNNGGFWITSVNDVSDYIDVTNAARTDGTADEATNAPAVGDTIRNFDSRITSNNELIISYAYDTETAGGNVTAGADQDMVYAIGGIDNSKTRIVEFPITKSANIPVDATTGLETN